MVTANGKMMEFALLAGNRFGYLESRTDKLATKTIAPTAAQRWMERMMKMAEFLLGAMIGAIVGVGIMCIFALAGEEK